jgi:hypothetical protein
VPVPEVAQLGCRTGGDRGVHLGCPLKSRPDHRERRGGHDVLRRHLRLRPRRRRADEACARGGSCAQGGSRAPGGRVHLDARSDLAACTTRRGCGRPTQMNSTAGLAVLWPHVRFVQTRPVVGAPGVGALRRPCALRLPHASSRCAEPGGHSRPHGPAPLPIGTTRLRPLSRANWGLRTGSARRVADRLYRPIALPAPMKRRADQAGGNQRASGEFRRAMGALVSHQERQKPPERTRRAFAI